MQNLDGLDSPSNLHFLQTFFKAFGDPSLRNNCDFYHRQLYDQQFSAMSKYLFTLSLSFTFTFTVWSSETAESTR